MVEVFRPTSLPEALELRAKHRPIPFAGGTDLMVRLRRGAGALPGFDGPVLFLDRCLALRGIRQVSGGLEVGAMTALAALAESPLVPPLLREAVLQIGGPGLRSVATLGGNLCNASPAADPLPVLYCLEAQVRLRSARSERTLPIQELVLGPGRTSLRQDELLLSVFLPAAHPSVELWRKVGTRRANALSKVSIAALAEVAGGRIRRARIALGAVAPTVVRLAEIERLLEGAASPGPLRGKIRRLCGEAVQPIDDQRSTAEYRRTVAVNLVDSFIDRLEACLRQP